MKKKLLDIIRKAVALRETLEGTDAFEVMASYHYITGQIRILEYIIDQDSIIKKEELDEQLIEMYQLTIGDSMSDTLSTNDERAMLLGAADILAWILDIPREQHEANIAA